MKTTAGKLAAKLHGPGLDDADLAWIEAQLPLIENKFARFLILILLLHARRIAALQKHRLPLVLG